MKTTREKSKRQSPLDRMIALRKFCKTCDLPAPARLVLWTLFSHCGEDWTCDPGISLLVAETGLAEKTVRRHLQVLRESQVLEIEHRNSGSARDSNFYTLKIPNGQSDLSRIPERSESPVVTETAKGVHPSSKGSSKKKTQEKKKKIRIVRNSSEESSRSPKTREVSVTGRETGTGCEKHPNISEGHLLGCVKCTKVEEARSA